MSIKKILLLTACGVFSVLNLWVWHDVLKFESAPDMRVFFFDVGQGDAELIETKDGRQILIDGGPSSAILTRLGNVMPFGDRSLDAIIISHPHSDHVSGLVDVINRYDVGMIFESGAIYPTSEMLALEAAISKKGIARVYVDQPMTIVFGDGARLTLIAPDRSFVGKDVKRIHDSMVVGLLEYRDARVVFMGDAEKTVERSLIDAKKLEQVDILKVGHHGSKTSSSEYFLSRITPRVAIISVGKNKYGHPNQDVLGRLDMSGARVFRTDEDGTIEVRFVSSQVLLSSWRGVHKDIWERIL
jgi:beta-lactamase superfamily II metal-dependent hydrolase